MNTLERWVVIFLLLISGCAQVPICERFTMHPATGPHGEQIYWMNEENLEKMMYLIDGVRRGNCRLED